MNVYGPVVKVWDTCRKIVVVLGNDCNDGLAWLYPMVDCSPPPSENGHFPMVWVVGVVAGTVLALALVVPMLVDRYLWIAAPRSFRSF
jgi:hypothetical protein